MRGGLLRSGVTPILIIILIVGAIALLSGSAQAQSVPILHYNPGDTISYTGHVSSGSTAEIIVSSTTNVGVNGGNYQIQLSDINVPTCSIIISVHNAQTLTFGGSKFLGNVLGQDIWTPEVTNGYDPNTPYQYDTSSGRYSVRVFGQAAPGASSVSMDVYVKQTVPVSGGTYSISVSTSNLPSGLYYLSQNSIVVAEIYLGIDAPLTYTLNLHKGWNLFSLPIVPRDSQITSIFSNDQLNNINVIWDYNGGNWLYNTRRSGYTSQFSTLSVNKGYYVYCKAPLSVQIAGSAGSGVIPYSSLSKGWNLIGYPTTSSTDAESVYPQAYVLWKIDSSNGNWYYFTHRPGYTSQFTILTPGHGYWIYKK